mmetsp:Transcript_118940/g.237058  ORF Transcript_118940/g.237058 Transcript_118940/m.237058 type:complete len:741 (+) Transcript_118940:101-2323(+)
MKLYFATGCVGCLPPAVILCLFSQISPWSPVVIEAIAQVPRSIGYVSLTLTAVCVLIAWSVNKSQKLSLAVFWMLWWSILILGTATSVLALVHHPCFAVAFLAILGPALMYPMRFLAFPTRSSAEWMQAVWICTALAAAICIVVWAPWIILGFPGRQKWTDWPDPIRQLVSHYTITWKFAFVMWAAPPSIAFELMIVALVCWVRMKHVETNTQQNDIERQHGIIASLIKQLTAWLFVLFMLVWVCAALNATGTIQHNQKSEDMRQEVLGLAFLIFLGLALWTYDTLSQSCSHEELAHRVSSLRVVVETNNLLNNDWCRGFILLVGALPMAACIAFDSLFTFVRRTSTLEGWGLHFWADWRWSSVFVKALWLGVAYHGLVVGMGKVTVVLLSVVNEYVAGWPLFTVSAVMYTVALLLFLSPASPAMPIYMLMGIIMTSSAMQQGWDFVPAVAWASFIAFAMKLSFCVVAQKCIGGPCGSSVRIQHAVQIHTPYMRAVEELLIGSSDHIAKTALLLGGPDWPAAVLCGMLQIPILPILLHVSPVLFQSVIPSVLAGALMLAPEIAMKDTPMKNGSVKAMAEASLVVAGVLQMATSLLAFYKIQDVMEKRYDKLSEKRPQDSVLLEMDEASEARERAFWRELQWGNLAGWVKYLLVFGLVCMEFSMIILSGLIGNCFKEFSLTSSIENDLGGDVFAIVQPLGWVAILLGCSSALTLAAFYAWARVVLGPEDRKALEHEGARVV